MTAGDACRNTVCVCVCIVRRISESLSRFIRRLNISILLYPYDVRNLKLLRQDEPFFLFYLICFKNPFTDISVIKQDDFLFCRQTHNAYILRFDPDGDIDYEKVLVLASTFW